MGDRVECFRSAVIPEVSNCSPSSPKPPMQSTDGMSRQRFTPYKPTIIHDNCKNYNSGSSSTLILDLKLFIVEQLTQLSDKPWANRIQPRPLLIRPATTLQRTLFTDLCFAVIFCLLCVDYRKAFYSVLHKRLIERLKEYHW